MRCAEHTDVGCLTILKIDDAPGGLQVKTPDDRWLPVLPLASPDNDSLFVNIGDVMARWTNNKLRSALHRVVMPSADQNSLSRRLSLVFFCAVNYDTVIETLPTCGAGTADEYNPKMSFIDMLEAKLNKLSLARQ